MADLTGKVAVVTGASRGVGKGIVLGLAEAGATVYATSRTVAGDGMPRNRHLVFLRCDHTVDEEVEAVFQRLMTEQGRVDILVNNVWGGYERLVEAGEFTWAKPFWEQPLWRWEAMFAAGVRAHYVSSIYAARTMVTQRSGLIVNLSFWAARKHMGNVAYGVAKAATDKMTADMAQELRAYQVGVVSLYPGLVRTEKVMESATYFDLSNSESPQFSGRAVAAALAQEYGFTDIDGKQPRPLTLADA